MKKIICIFAIISLSPIAVAAAWSQTPPGTRTMTCVQAKNAVERDHTLVLSTGPGLFDRYVAREGSCDHASESKPAFVRTLDNPACNIGYYCSPDADTGN